jgi:hypothetical protein
VIVYGDDDPGGQQQPDEQPEGADLAPPPASSSRDSVAGRGSYRQENTGPERLPAQQRGVQRVPRPPPRRPPSVRSAVTMLDEPPFDVGPSDRRPFVDVERLLGEWFQRRCRRASPPTCQPPHEHFPRTSRRATFRAHMTFYRAGAIRTPFTVCDGSATFCEPTGGRAAPLARSTPKREQNGQTRRAGDLRSGPPTASHGGSRPFLAPGRLRPAPTGTQVTGQPFPRAGCGPHRHDRVAR